LIHIGSVEVITKTLANLDAYCFREINNYDFLNCRSRSIERFFHVYLVLYISTKINNSTMATTHETIFHQFTVNINPQNAINKKYYENICKI